MDKIVKLLLAQLGFVFLGVFLSLPLFCDGKGRGGNGCLLDDIGPVFGDSLPCMVYIF